jgi:hypothetical protein
MQTRFSDLEYRAKKKLIRRGRLPARIDGAPPWGKLPGVGAASRLRHTVIGTAGSVADVTQTHTLPQGSESTHLEMRLIGLPLDHLARQPR